MIGSGLIRALLQVVVWLEVMSFGAHPMGWWCAMAHWHKLILIARYALSDVDLPDCTHLFQLSEPQKTIVISVIRSLSNCDDP
jgi:hypothetical protein